ncbi:MAG: orotidine-5'-phosphate decarboxylase [Alphaproteobacteria bacterium]
MSASPVYVAIDTTDKDQAVRWAGTLAGHVGGLKLGLEFFGAHGPQGVAQVARAGVPVFIDLKFHDIPNTVAGAVRSVLALKPSILTVHASGGPAMLRAAMEAAKSAGDARPKIVAVTVLTSLDANDLAAVGQAGDTALQVVRLAKLAQQSGVDGIVCAPTEAKMVRAACGRNFFLVVPGVRPSWADANDQKRVMTPREAIEAGADVLVIGRPITQATDPKAAAERIHADLR